MLGTASTAVGAAVYFALAVGVAPHVFAQKATLAALVTGVVAVSAASASAPAAGQRPRVSDTPAARRRRVSTWMMYLVLLHTLLFAALTLIKPPAPARLAMKLYDPAVHGALLLVLYTSMVNFAMRGNSPDAVAVFERQLYFDLLLPLAVCHAAYFVYVCCFFALNSRDALDTRTYFTSLAALASLGGVGGSMLWMLVALVLRFAHPGTRVT